MSAYITIPYLDCRLLWLVNWTGKLVGCAVFEPLRKRVGFKKTIYVLSVIQIVAVVREFNY